MQIEPGIHDTGTHVFNHGDFDMEDFRTARAYAQDDKYRMGCKDGQNLLTFSLNPSRDRDLHMANYTTEQAIIIAINDSYFI